MVQKKIQKHVYLTPENVEALDDLIQNKVGINTYSEAIRYIIGVYSKDISEEDSKTNQRKLNALSKNVDILIEMVAGGLHEQDVKSIGPSEDAYVYMDAKKNVEAKIQKATTMKSNTRKKINMTPAEREPKQSLTRTRTFE
jgi:hypothetical protein